MLLSLLIHLGITLPLWSAHGGKDSRAGVLEAEETRGGQRCCWVSCVLDIAVGADDVLYLVRVGVLEGEAAGANQHPLPVLGAEAVHDRQHLALELHHLSDIGEGCGWRQALPGVILQLGCEAGSILRVQVTCWKLSRRWLWSSEWQNSRMSFPSRSCGERPSVACSFSFLIHR